MAIDPSIITNGAINAQLQQQQNMQALGELGGNLGRLVLGRRINQMRQLEKPEDQQAFANNSIFSPFLNDTLRADKAAAAKAAADQLKFDADLNKTYAETNKLGSESGKIATETGITRQNNTGSIWSAFLTGGPVAAKAQLENMKNNGVISPESYQAEIDALTNMPTNATEAQQYALGRFKGLQDAKYSLPTTDNVLDNNTSADNNIRSTNAQIYGINKTAETADENRAVQVKRLEFDQQQAEIKNGQGEIKEANGKLWIVYKDGTARPAVDANGTQLAASKGGGAMTEQQSKDALFGARMQEANKILSALEAKDIKAPVMNSLPFGDKFSNALPSILGGASAEQQQYVQAQRDFINAVLRKESGAVIADSEFANAQKQYFPQIGDSDEVIAQKAKNRELAMNMIVGGAGNQGRELISKTTSAVPYANAGSGGASLPFYK